MSRLWFRTALRLVPRRWRESVAEDLLEEAARPHRQGWLAGPWVIAQAVGIALRLAARALLDRWGEAPGWRGVADSLRLDVRMALRAGARQPSSTAAIVLTLALGMSAGTAAFAVFNHVLFRPTPGVGDPDGLATVYFQTPGDQATYKSAPRQALEALRQADAFEWLGAADSATLPVVARSGADPDYVRVEFLTDRYLDVLRVRPRVGRLPTDEEIASGQPVAVVSEPWWRREFAADASAIGRSIVVNRQPVVIVGVLADYRGWGAVRIGSVDLWMPIDTAIGRDAVSPDRVFSLVGRLRPGVTVAVAEQQLRAPFAPYAGSLRTVMSMGPMSDAPAGPVVYPGLHEIGAEQTRGSIARMYPLAIGASGLLLLLACANTANLLLVRTMRRRSELAVRSAIGASRSRLARGLIIEAAVLASLATVAAVGLARALVGLTQGQQLFQVGPALDAVALDWRILVFSAALGATTVVLFGLAPALMASRPAMLHALAGSGRTTRAGRRLRAGLVAVQLALAMTLLAGAGVFVRSLQNLRGIDLGMNADGVVSFRLNPVRLGYGGDRADAIVGDTLARLQSAAGVEAVGFAAPSPFWRGHRPAMLRTRPGDEASEQRVPTTVVNADYFRALDIPILAGRVFTASEFRRGRSSAGVGIVSESLARRLFGDAPAVGRHVYLSQAARGWELHRTLEIVGVVGDTRSGIDLRAADRAALYEASGANPSQSSFFVRSRLAPPQAIEMARNTVRGIDANLPMADAGSLRDEIDRLVPEDRMLALVLAGVALIATLLGVAGVHAVIAHTVAERTREFGIRLALGASRRAVSIGVLRGIVGVASLGIVGGLALFAGASRLLESRVYGVSPTDPLTLVAVSLLLGAAAIAGAWLPARRATRVDPALALRVE